MGVGGNFHHPPDTSPPGPVWIGPWDSRAVQGLKKGLGFIVAWGKMGCSRRRVREKEDGEKRRR